MANKFTEVSSQWSDRKIFIIHDFMCRGMVQIEFADGRDYGFIYNLYVHPDFRQKGLATALLKQAELRIKQNGRNIAALEWEKKESEYFVIDWYTRNGYEEKEFDNRGALLKKKL